MAATVPKLVFVHGAWHPSSTWDKVRAELEQEFETIAPQLISVGDDPTMNSQDDAAQLSMVMHTLAKQGRDIVVVTHSYGAIPTGDAIYKLSKRGREAAGQIGGVVAQVHITAWTIAQGQSLESTIHGPQNYHPTVVVDEKVCHAVGFSTTYKLTNAVDRTSRLGRCPGSRVLIQRSVPRGDTDHQRSAEATAHPDVPVCSRA